MAQYGMIKTSKTRSRFHGYPEGTIVRLITAIPSDHIPFCVPIAEYADYIDDIDRMVKGKNQSTIPFDVPYGYWVPLKELTLLSEKRCRKLDLEILAELI
jgi:hypothetical protein